MLNYERNKSSFVGENFMTMLNANSVNNDSSSITESKLLEPISDLLFNEVEAKNLRFRLHLMLQVLDYMRREQLTEQQAARKLKVKPATIQHLAQRKISLLTTDQLLNMLEHCGFNVYEQLVTVMNVEQ